MKSSNQNAVIKALPVWFAKPLGWLFTALGFLFRVALICWTTLALNFSNLPWAWLRLVLAATFLAFSIWALWLTRRPRMGWAFAALVLGVAVWWSFILPSHDRPWRPEVAVMPRASIDGDCVRITGSGISNTARGMISRCDTKSARCRSRI